MSLASLIKRLQDIMRKDSGVDGDAQRLAQIVWLIFLKVFDYKEEEAELTVDGYEPVIPEGYRWRDWAVGNSVKTQLTGPDLLDFVNNKLIPVLSGDAIVNEKGERVVLFEKADARSLMVKEFMRDCINYMKNGYLLRDVVNLFNEVDLEDSGEAHEFNDMYEGLLRGLQAAGTMGEFYTNRAITDFAISKVDPQIGGTLADWAMGTGGFLISTLDHMRKQFTPGDVEAQKQLQKAVRGAELKPMPYKLGITNLLLHDIELPSVRYGDSLAEKNLHDFRGSDLVDYCALNPPYGGVALPEDLQSFPADLRSSETADLFVALAVKRLRNGGRGVIVLPDGFLLGSDNAAKVAIKKFLLKECNLHTIIRLPQSCFAPYTSIATNLLFFDKGESTQEIWFYRLDMPDGYKHFSKTKPMKREHFACVDAWWNDRHEIVDEKDDEAKSTTYKAKKYTIDEIIARGYDLDLCGYPAEEKIILSPEETIQNYIEKKRALEAKLTAATDNLRDFLLGDHSVELVNIKSLSDQIGELDAAFPGDMKAALIQAAMQGKLTEQLPGDGTAAELLARIKAERERLVQERKLQKEKPIEPSSLEEVPFDIPSNWEWSLLYTLVARDIRRGKSPVYGDGQHYAFAQKCNSKYNGILLELALHVTDTYAAKHTDDDKLHDMDIVVNSTGKGTLGRAGMYEEKFNNTGRNYYPDSHVTVVRSLIVDPKYILTCLRYYQDYLESKGEGSTNQKELKPDTIKKLWIPIPPLAEQHRIVEMLDKLLPLCESLQVTL